MERFDISVIIPIYKGKQYLTYLLNTLYNNFRSNPCLQNEVIFVNDDPDERLVIETDWNNKINIQVVNLPENHGIHYARITGLSMARGDYIFFLDQDDKITKDYIVSQRKNIGDGDAVLCNGYTMRYCMDGRKMIYPDMASQKNATVLEEFVNQGNQIISPGQVLIKKASISALWTKAVVIKNGADDYLLWILMLSEGKKININIDKLYTHVGHGSNSSQNVIGMSDSLREVLQILRDNSILSRPQLAIMKSRVDHYLGKNKLLSMIEVYDQWMYLKVRNKNIAEYLLCNGIKKIAIYGMNYLGNRLYDELKSSEIEIIVGIDQNADGILYEMPVKKPDDTVLRKYMREVDLIIVTAVVFYQEIKKEMVRYYSNPIVSLNEILLDMLPYV